MSAGRSSRRGRGRGSYEDMGCGAEGRQGVTQAGGFGRGKRTFASIVQSGGRFDEVESEMRGWGGGLKAESMWTGKFNNR